MAEEAWRVVSGAGATVTQVKERYGGLAVYHTGSQEVSDAVRRITDQSLSLCEGCGQPGRLWPEDEAEEEQITAATGRVPYILKTLCPNCGHRWYYDGARQWADVRGEREMESE